MAAARRAKTTAPACRTVQVARALELDKDTQRVGLVELRPPAVAAEDLIPVARVGVAAVHHYSQE